jgi:SAM-dependent methyltransferase
MNERDLAEVARSKSEAGTIAIRPVDLERYMNPPVDTPYPLEYVFHLLGDVYGKAVLDLGCGSGEVVVPLAKRGADVVGIDVSPELIVLAAERTRQAGVSATLKVASAYETGLPDESIDVVLCISVLHHLNLPVVREEIRRLLRKGGLFILKEPIRLSRTMGFVRRLLPSREDVSEYEHPLTAQEVSAIRQDFDFVASRSFRLPLVRFAVNSDTLWRLDRWFLNSFPVLAHFATSRVVALRK